MKNFFPLTALALLLFALLAATPVSAKVELQTKPAVKTAARPVDVALTADGRRSFVLSEGGLVTIYGVDGNLVDSFKVDPATDHLSVDGIGSQLYLSSNKNGTVSQVFVNYQADLDYSGSPFLGKSDAPVVLAVFSDFQ
jgi:hypothetical protein